MSDIAETIRLNQYIAASGWCSRRKADLLIAAGQVTVDDEIAVIGSRVSPGQTVRIDGQPVIASEDYVYLALYKPQGIICTTDRRRDDNIIDFLDYPLRVFPVGRLDRDSEGLIFLTNDGPIVNKILRASNVHEKEYIVSVDKPVTEEFLRQMAGGVPILGTVTRPCRLRKISARRFAIILTQGLNRQIRRMCEYFGYDVLHLIRVRIMHVTLDGLQPGQWRYLTPHEIKELRRLTRNSRQ